MVSEKAFMTSGRFSVQDANMVAQCGEHLVFAQAVLGKVRSLFQPISAISWAI